VLKALSPNVEIRYSEDLKIPRIKLSKEEIEAINNGGEGSKRLEKDKVSMKTGIY